jgi:hypothetical protein
LVVLKPSSSYLHFPDNWEFSHELLCPGFLAPVKIHSTENEYPKDLEN